ncbi:MAG: FHA domain-containing protein [Gammaproteobacteria bacterium]|nr:FHA domain-containing protein [Gammaproteobacteria bacterium]
MKGTQNINIEHMEGRTFILGREGHIYIDSPTASKYHAEIKILGGKIHLRDLDSSNGTYLLKNKELVYFEKGFVSPLQPVVIGNQKHVIQDLLAIAGNFVASDEAVTELDLHQQDAGIQAS